MATSTRALLVAFFAVVVAFIGSTLWAQKAAKGIDADTLLISRDAAPGIQVLSDLRAELRSLELEANRAVSTLDATQVAASRSRIDALMAQAVALPNDPVEAALMGRLQSELRAFDEGAERAIAQARAGEKAAAFATLDHDARRHGNDAAGYAKDLVDYDARVAEAAAVRIEQARLRSNRFAFQLDALCAVLAVVAAFLALRVIQQVHRVQDEHQRLVERKADELEQFAGRVAHDVLSPLGAVGLSLAIASRTSAPEAQEAIARGKASLTRVRGIVDGLLEFARAGAQPEPGVSAKVRPVVAGLEEELLPYAAEQAAMLHVEAVPSCAVACSPGVLLSVVGNLIRNALKYLGEAQVREVTLRIRRRRGHVLFEVEDTGPGIPPSLTERVFEPYVRGPNTNLPGIGLGLATVKRLVVSHGGSVGVRAAPRGGALFWFELPEAPLEEQGAWDEAGNLAGPN